MNSVVPAAVARRPDLSAARLKRRYAAERRFRLYGLVTISMAIAVLAVLLGTIVVNGYSAFIQTQIAIDVDFDRSVIDPEDTKNPEVIAQADFRALARSGVRALMPEGVGRSEERELFNVFSSGNQYELASYVLRDPSVIGTKRRVWVKAAPDIDMLRKEYLVAAADGTSRVNKRQADFVGRLDAGGRIRGAFNRTLFTAADSREPEQAGILGALVGSALTLLVTLVLVVPFGIAAAVYLEEFAARNRWTDLIEVNVNNLAAVPSIVFGLLGLAVLLNWLGMPRSAPLAGGTVLALMTLPTIIIAGRSALKAVPPSIREAALAVGASPLQMVGHHVLPLALPGMLTGTIIGMARALGESAPLLMIGMVAFIVDVPRSLTDASTVLPVQIFLWADAPERAFVEKTSAAIIVLLAFLIAMNLVAIVLRNKFEKRW